MDTFELNKILGAVLGTSIVVLSANIFATDRLFADAFGQSRLITDRTGESGPLGQRAKLSAR
jgi:hypothetical protein